MTYKSLITTLLFVFILSACGSNVETTQPTSTSIPTLQATSTFTPEPTATNTSIPTETPFQYASCLDPVLMEEIETGFIEKFKMTINEYIKKIVGFGKYHPEYHILPADNSQADYLLVGGAEISLSTLPGADKGDTAFCLYFVDDSETTTLVPMILSYTYKGEFNKISWITDGYGSAGTGIALNSMEDIRNWWGNDSSGLPVGDVFSIDYHSFAGTSTADQVSRLQEYKVGYPDAVSNLIELSSGNDYLTRIAGVGSPVLAAKQLKPELGDIGLFPGFLSIREHNPLDN